MRHDATLRAAPIAGLRAAVALFAPLLAGLNEERLCVAYLDADLRLLDLSVCATGGLARVALPLRRILRDALGLEAAALLLAHNHPRGGARPSAADRRVTRRVADVAHAVDLRVLDHIVFGRGGVASFRALALL